MVRVAAGLLLGPHGAQKLSGWFGCHGKVSPGGYGASCTSPFWSTCAADWFWSYLTYSVSVLPLLR